ncbi:prepilin-type N-terminal cleavage/methylation domain-containing protein [Dehalococcoidia bacterium]|nr:prepilin-type N-terminal cleavage/methylation domain-containing protein [Dehalococcoidia bacterium]MCL0037257.1 prepilin-type N-terminal cleavage/methylation domain-containing protein [Dehalococcoidia bacterium]MCL0039010.1 prepilin-type N-terminal cleavage/methylation domain-containing protein [Dehalococcoidia bacterium]MCL0090871.1 prepilin-type N-terminal cleavage/methylation domain-containing protein [Dehalococcoidia bacterium]MCL0092964.1 prepilin-type N-terminal cleavage/methylation do
MQCVVVVPNRGTRQKGQTLIEIMVALALAAIIMPAIFTAVSLTLTSADRIRDRSVMMELAQSQMESIQGQEFRPHGDYHIIALPEGYAMEIKVRPAASFFYPDGSPAAEIIQRVTITLSSRQSSFTLEGYKVKR